MSTAPDVRQRAIWDTDKCPVWLTANDQVLVSSSLAFVEEAAVQGPG